MVGQLESRLGVKVGPGVAGAQTWWPGSLGCLGGKTLLWLEGGSSRGRRAGVETAVLTASLPVVLKLSASGRERTVGLLTSSLRRLQARRGFKFGLQRTARLSTPRPRRPRAQRGRVFQAQLPTPRSSATTPGTAACCSPGPSCVGSRPPCLQAGSLGRETDSRVNSPPSGVSKLHWNQVLRKQRRCCPPRC